MSLQASSVCFSDKVITKSDLVNQLLDCQDTLFTGHFAISDPLSRCTWDLLFFHGRIVADAGGLRPENRWARHVRQWCPEAEQELMQIQTSSTDSIWYCYQHLHRCYRQALFSREQATAMISHSLLEVLFDLFQRESGFPEGYTFTYTKTPSTISESAITFIKIDHILEQTKQLWQQWHALGLIYSPHSIPEISEPLKLKNTASPQSFTALSSLVTGDRSIYDLALILKQPPSAVAKSLKTYVDKEIIKLKTIQPTQPQAPNPTTPLICYIEDNLVAGKRMKRILSSTPCRYQHLQEPLYALPVLLERNPSLIFLDLVMDIINGYELCAQIRRVSKFRNTPVIMITSKDGLVDRVRAKVVGASGFIAKPFEPAEIYQNLYHYGIIQTLPEAEIEVPPLKAV